MTLSVYRKLRRNGVRCYRFIEGSLDTPDAAREAAELAGPGLYMLFESTGRGRRFTAYHRVSSMGRSIEELRQMRRAM